MTAVDTSTSARPRGAARRAALLDATLALLAEHGADGVTHRAVAARADLPLASTTYWFESKEQLLTEALRHAADRDCARLRAAGADVLAAAERTGAPIDASTIVDVTLGPPVRDERAALLATYALMLESARRPALQSISREWSAAYRSVYAELLARAGSTTPAADARLMLAAVDGLLIDHLATGGDAGADDPRRELVRLLDALLSGGTR